MWIKRDISEKIMDLSKIKPSFVLTGARQVGKTSLLKDLFPLAQYVTFDHPQVASEAESNPMAFLEKFQGPVILDEIQYVPSIFRYLKIMIDRNPKENGKWILTGSQKFTLMKEISESLAGRIAICELESLSVNEIRNQAENITHYLFRGGYPELWQNQELNPTQFYQDYVITYLQRDLRNFLDVSNIRSFDRFLRSTALRTANLTNFSDVARDAGVTSPTGKKWYQALEASSICYSLEPYFSNHLKRLVKSPKIYFNDIGLLNYVLNITSETSLKASPFFPVIYENFVLGELLRYSDLDSSRRQLFFLRDKHNLEVDFLIDRGDEMILIEVKTAEFPEQAMNQLHIVAKQFEKKFKVRKIIACQTPSKEKFKIGDVEFVNPLYQNIL